MSIEAGQRYKGKITAADFYEASTGSLSLQLEVTPAGETKPLYVNLWITEKAKERTAEVLSEFGVTAADRTFWANPAAPLVGQDCDFTTKLNDKGFVEIQFLNGPQRKRAYGVADRDGAVKRAAAMFAKADDSSVPW